ncbi:FecR domain-containing protein, partial [Phaeodactylibacter sp.]
KRESKLTYLEPFSEGERSVQLIGEGFFEIAKDPQRPFIVRTDHLDTRVLGTSFNLKAEEGDSIVQVALVEGSVEVIWDAQRDTSVRISPGEQLTYHHQVQRAEKERFVSDAPYAWKNGVIYFTKADVYEVAMTLEKWYGKPFKIKGDSLISGKLVHRYNTKKLTLNEVLQGISKVMDYRFEAQANGDILILPKD